MALHAMGPAPPPMGDHLGPLALDFAKIGANLAQLGVFGHVLTLAQSILLTIDLVWVAPMPTTVNQPCYKCGAHPTWQNTYILRAPQTCLWHTCLSVGENDYKSSWIRFTIYDMIDKRKHQLTSSTMLVIIRAPIPINHHHKYHLAQFDLSTI